MQKLCKLSIVGKYQMKFLVTGAAGFIGNFVAERLCIEGHDVIGLDNLNDYYDPNLKLARLKRIKHLTNFTFVKISCNLFMFSEDCFNPFIVKFNWLR